MVVLVASGFGLQLAMGRSSFAVAIYLHVHAFIFFGWTVLYLVQNALGYTGSVAAPPARLDRAGLGSRDGRHG